MQKERIEMDPKKKYYIKNILPYIFIIIIAVILIPVSLFTASLLLFSIEFIFYGLIHNTKEPNPYILISIFGMFFILSDLYFTYKIYDYYKITSQKYLN